MRVVIDTNVVVSAVIRDRNPEEVVLFVAEHTEYQWIASPQIVDEYVSVLSRPKFKLLPETIEKWKKIFDTRVEIVEPEQEIDFPRDQKDAKFLECCLTADADFFITGDKDFEEAYKVVDTTVISVSLFKTTIIDVLASKPTEENNLE